MVTRTTEELLRQHLSGGEAAASALVSRFRPIATAAALRACGDRDLAQDAAQEALVRALTNVGQLREPERFGEWLGTIARNEAYARLRRRGDVLIDAATRQPGPEVPPLPGSSLPGNDETFETSDATRLAREAISRLPGRLRQVLELRYFHGCSYQEIAQELRIPVTTAKSRLQMARDLFREWYDELDTCEYSQEHLESFLGGRLPFEDAWEVHNHVFLCDHCLQRMLDLSAVRAEVLLQQVHRSQDAYFDLLHGLPWEWRRLEGRLVELVERDPGDARGWLLLADWSEGLEETPFYSAEPRASRAHAYATIAADVDPHSSVGLRAQTALAGWCGEDARVAELVRRRADRLARLDAPARWQEQVDLLHRAGASPELLQSMLQDTAGQLRGGGPQGIPRRPGPGVSTARPGPASWFDQVRYLCSGRRSRLADSLRLLAIGLSGYFSERFQRLAQDVWALWPGSHGSPWHPWMSILAGDYRGAAAGVEALARAAQLLPGPSGETAFSRGTVQMVIMLAAATSEPRCALWLRDLLRWLPPAWGDTYTRQFLAAAPGLRPALGRLLGHRLPDVRAPRSRRKHLRELLAGFVGQGDVPERLLVKVAPDTRPLLAPRRVPALDERSDNTSAR